MKYLLVAMFLCSCASTGRNYNTANLAHLKPGVTKEAEVVRLLGAKPYMRVYGPDGSYTAVWMYISAMLGVIGDMKSVYIMFDENRTFKQISSITEN